MTPEERAAEAERRLRKKYNFIGNMWPVGDGYGNDESPAADGEIAALLLDLFKESR